jgi:transcriptional regulator with XRE-family HTH domain
MGNHLANRFKEIRTAAGDTPARAAEKIGISRQGYVKWENGDTKNMTLNNLLIFCDKYNVEVEPLIRCARADDGKAGAVYYHDKATVLTLQESSAGDVIDFPNGHLTELMAIARKINDTGLIRLTERAAQLAEDYPVQSLGNAPSSH